jgi:DNA-binding transcriptional regulator YhcF (GntR family)
MGVEQQKTVYEFMKKELKCEPDPEKVESNLTTIIKILSEEDWRHETTSFETIPFDIEGKISYNQLVTSRDLIEDHKIHSSRIDKIYSTYDKQGVNKSLSILNGIRTEYAMLCSENTPDQCFFKIIEKVTQKILESANYTHIPEEELKLCVQLLVVNAFMRCKIFKNPSGYIYARS